MKKHSDAFTRQKVQLSCSDDVAESWEKELRATCNSLLVDPLSSISDMMVIADGYRYGYPQQRVISRRVFPFCCLVFIPFLGDHSLFVVVSDNEE